MRLSRFAIDLSRFSQHPLINRGAIVQVCEATDPTTGEKAALKFYFSSRVHYDQQLIFRELECLAACAHPVLLRLIGFCLKPSPEVLVEFATEFQQNGTQRGSETRTKSSNANIECDTTVKKDFWYC
jgi:serine/threonine protein kinase